MYVKGAGYMVGLFNDPSLPLVHIHQVAGFFDGKVLPEKFEVKSTRDTVGADSFAVKIVAAREASGRHFTYAEKNGEVQWLEMLGRNGSTEKINIEEYKEFKGLTKKGQNLRDHMDDLELIFTMLGERVTTEISEKEKPETFGESKKVARRGGKVAGVARRETEKELGRSVSTRKNFLPEGQKEVE